MKNAIVRTAMIALFAAGFLHALAATAQPGPPQKGSPIPVCYQCGHFNSGN